MNGPHLLTTVLTAAMLAGASVAADPGVNKCSDAEGHLLLTDQPCSAGFPILLANSPTPAPAPDAAATDPAPDEATLDTPASADEVLAAIVTLRRPPLAHPLPIIKPLRPALAIDIDTVVHARLAMAADDAAAAERRALRD